MAVSAFLYVFYGALGAFAILAFALVLRARVLERRNPTVRRMPPYWQDDPEQEKPNIYDAHMHMVEGQEAGWGTIMPLAVWGVEPLEVDIEPPPPPTTKTEGGGGYSTAIFIAMPSEEGAETSGGDDDNLPQLEIGVATNS
ncbi:hypothetical protein FB45DRAFT_1000044 [Roridomyces roridus]|uniref:Uncharacterized protein n=1 Tax=Roridomyces roridus TaxID=1738132 RepID=A0AAD7C7M8_9AGAR|nr:hypothetical protein FB45DRAFT_1000044 [Roridomyces roridus]